MASLSPALEEKGSGGNARTRGTLLRRGAREIDSPTTVANNVSVVCSEEMANASDPFLPLTLCPSPKLARDEMRVSSPGAKFWHLSRASI